MKFSQFIVLDILFIDLVLVGIWLVFYVLDAMDMQKKHVADRWRMAIYLKEPSKIS